MIYLYFVFHLYVIYIKILLFFVLFVDQDLKSGLLYFNPFQSMALVCKIKDDLNFLIQEEDTFGLNDSDWDVYKQISRDAEESDSEEETLKAQV